MFLLPKTWDSASSLSCRTCEGQTEEVFRGSLASCCCFDAGEEGGVGLSDFSWWSHLPPLAPPLDGPGGSLLCTCLLSGSSSGLGRPSVVETGLLEEAAWELELNGVLVGCLGHIYMLSLGCSPQCKKWSKAWGGWEVNGGPQLDQWRVPGQHSPLCSLGRDGGNAAVRQRGRRGMSRERPGGCVGRGQRGRLTSLKKHQRHT